MALTSYPETLFIFTLVVVSTNRQGSLSERTSDGSDEFTSGSEMKLEVLCGMAKMAARVRHFLRTCMFELHKAYET